MLFAINLNPTQDINQINYRLMWVTALPYLEFDFKDSKLTGCSQIVYFSNVTYEQPVK